MRKKKHFALSFTLFYVILQVGMKSILTATI